MTIKRFDKVELFKKFVSEYGLNLFLGAGFSIYAYNNDDEPLPLGNQICERLCKTFEVDINKFKTLGKVCRKIKLSQEDEMKVYLRNTYKVKEFDPAYNCLPTLPIKNIFSINIDDLIEKIYSNPNSIKDISDVLINGNSCKENIVPLFKLHGSVTYSITERISFTEEELRSLFLENYTLFQAVSYNLSCAPSVFWGTSLSDGNTVQLLCNSKINNKNNMPKWIVLYPDDPNYNFLCEEFQEEDFNIIAADTKDLLLFLTRMPFVASVDNDKYIYRKYREMFPNNFVCNELRKTSIARPVSDFFHGAEPQISDVLSSNVTKTSTKALFNP